jgi:sec-independent protein translocase protein TatA
MGATEIAFIFLIYLLLFGAKGIPSMARTMGSTVRQFRQATDGIRNEVNKVRDAADPMSKKPQKATNVQEDAGSTAGPIPPKDTPDTA